MVLTLYYLLVFCSIDIQKRSPPSKAVPKLVLARCSGDGFYYEGMFIQYSLVLEYTVEYC